MSKYFNITAACNPDKHYMVNIERQINAIRRKVDRGEYFVMNRARQYGKTTTLRTLRKSLADEYIVISLDFQMLSNDIFSSESSFSQNFAKYLTAQSNHLEGLDSNALKRLQLFSENNDNHSNLYELFNLLSDLCASAKKKIVLLIDEVDSASNHQVFLDFLSQLRGYYIARDEHPTFHSVILAGVYDIKNLKRKIRPNEEHKTNSPWNIASKFNVDMSFSAVEISSMLKEYEQDYHTGMDITQIAELIYDYTSGYPFLVSDLCKIIDEEIAGNEQFPELCSAWTKEGFLESVKILLAEQNTLFESLVHKLEEYPELENIIYHILFQGDIITYSPDNSAINIGIMFGFIKVVNGMVVVSNRLFETRLYNYFLSLEEMRDTDIYKTAVQNKNYFIENGMLNMELILEQFTTCFSDLYGDRDEKFLEEDGRRFFLLFLRPIINGTGNYYIEAQTRDARRTDVIVDYLGKQYIIELKIWHGEEYNRRGEEQLEDYLDAYHLKKGYMISFNFNKNKEVGLKQVVCGDKVVIEAVV